MRKRLILGGLGIILGVSILSGCQSTGQANTSVMGQVNKTKVNGEKIDSSDYEKRVTNAKNALQSWGISMKDNNDFEKIVDDSILNNMITELLVEQKAKELKVELSKEEKDQFVKEIKASFSGFKEDTMMDSFESKLLNSKILNELYKKITVSDQEISEYYQANKDKFKKEDTYRLYQILMDNSEKANQAKKELDQGKSFAEVAKKYSIDVNTADKGGDIGSLSLSAMNKDVAATIKDMKENQITKPIQVMNSYRILKVGKITVGDYYSLEESKENIKGYLQAKKGLEASTSFYKELKEKAKIEK